MNWPDLLHIVEVLVGVLIGLTTIYYGQLLFRGQRTKAATALAATTISQQDATITAQGERIALLESDAQHKREVDIQKDRLIESQAARITYLENVVTARDLIEQQGRMIHAGFSYLNVPDAVLAAP